MAAADESGSASWGFLTGQEYGNGKKHLEEFK